MVRSLNAVVAALALCACAATGLAQDVKGFRADLLGQLAYVQKQVLELENAIPDAKMTWRPGKDVRSISEVYSHIAFGNYLFAKFAGATLPEGIAAATPADEAKWDKMTTDKKVIAENLAKSYDFITGVIKAMPDAQLETMVSFFGQQMTTRSLLMVLLSHTHEHLGQSIAYARMNGVVPPWTAAREAQQKPKQ